MRLPSAHPLLEGNKKLHSRVPCRGKKRLRGVTNFK